MLKKTITIILLVFGFFASQAQYTFQHIFKDPNFQAPGNIIETSNGDYIFSITNVYPIHESKIMKIDKEGIIVDSIVIPDVINVLYTLFKYDENSFFVCGEWNIDDKYSFWLRKYDYNLQLLNELSVPISGHSNLVRNPMISNNKSNLIISITCQSSSTSSEVHLFEITPNCEVIKYKEYSSAIASYADDILQKDSLYYLFFTGFLHKGFCEIYKLDSAFNILNVYSMDASLVGDCNNAKWVNDSVIVFSGRIRNVITNFWETKLLKFKIDTSIYYWHYPLKDTVFAKNDSNNFIAKKNNIDFIDVNNIFLGSFVTKEYYGGYLSNDYSHLVLYKLDSALHVKWEKEYGGDAYYMLISITATQDGGCIMTGTRYDYLTQTEETDPFVIKVNSEGNINWVHNLPSTFMKVSVYPNPGCDKLTVNNPPLNTSLVLYNTYGQAVITQSLNQSNSINTNSLQSGVYLYQLIDDKGKVLGAGKWVKGKK